MERDAVSRLLESQRHEPRCRRNNGVSKTAGYDESGAVASTLWQRLPAGREHDRLRMKTAAGGCHLEAAGAGCHVEHTLTAHKRDAQAIGFTKQRVEHVARSIAVGKQLAAGLFVKRHAE